MRKNLILALSLMMASFIPAGAAEAPAGAPDPGLEAMKAVAMMQGSWEGGGWMRRGPGEPDRFVGEETVETRLDGRVLLVEGKHWTPDRARVVHHAFAVLTYDQAKKGYRFSTQLANGRGGDFPARMEDGAFIWEMETPGGRTRYTIRIDGDRWHEVGHIERQGQWAQFFEMELRRKGK
jgi:hypothetical protein